MHHGENGSDANTAKTKNEKIELLIGCVIIGAVAVFVMFFSYINEPVGDDILGYYEGALTFYLDDFRNVLGEKLTSMSQIIKLLNFTYMHWSGRMPGYFINYLGKFMPKFVQAFLTAFVFTVNILLAMRIAYKEWIKTLSKPLVFGFIFLALYWYRYAVCYNYMWTMVSIYSFAVMFCLLYYNLAVIDYEQGKNIILGNLF